MGVEVRPWGGRGERREGNNCFLSELLSLPASLSSCSVMELFSVLTASTTAQNIGLRSEQQGLTESWVGCGM